MGALPLRRLKKIAASLGIDDAHRRYGEWLTVFDEEMRAVSFADFCNELAQRVDVFGVYRRYYRDGWSPIDRLLY